MRAVGLSAICLIATVSLECDLAAEESDWTIDFSGQYRIRVEDFAEPSIGLTPIDEFTSVAHRLLGSAEIRHRDRFKVFGQLGVFREDGRKPTARATDEGDLDVQQLYFDLQPAAGQRVPTLRVGRQEMTFGAGRLVSSRDSRNIRRSFDAVKFATSLSGARIQAFFGRPVELEAGSFDDEPDNSVAFWGMYGTVPRSTTGGFDVYYFGLDRDVAVFDQGIASERRHSLGARLFGRRNAWNWDSEAVLQFGQFGDGDIRAWFVGIEVGRLWKERKWSPRVALRSHLFSGDSDPADPELRTFNPLFPKTTFFTQMGLFFPANAIDFHPLISLSPVENLRLTASIDFFWRFSTDDALYRPPLVPRIPGDTNDQRYMGAIFELLLTWSPSRHAELTLAYDLGDTQGFIADAGGEDPRLLLVSAKFLF